MAQQEPVRVRVSVEWPGGKDVEMVEIDREEWDALVDNADRASLLARITEEHAANYVGSGWLLSDPEDLAATQ